MLHFDDLYLNQVHQETLFSGFGVQPISYFIP